MLETAIVSGLLYQAALIAGSVLVLLELRLLLVTGRFTTSITHLLSSPFQETPVDEQPILAWVEDQRATIDFSFFDIPRPPLQKRLELRARANRRLHLAFGIANSLTTALPETHKSFMKEASRVINAGDNMRWVELYDLAELHLGRDAESAENLLHLADCTQRLCLTIVLFDNFKVDPRDTPPEVSSFIASEINKQWLRSKGDEMTQESSDLNQALRGLGLRGEDGCPMAPQRVLGLIMPQYETLWRVVLLTFVTAYHRQARPENVERVRTVPQCLGNTEQEAEAVKLAKEGLRLYPSNKRIYRALMTSVCLPFSADVEACHRHERIWGPDALEFRPERFDRLSKLQVRAYFPYSLGQHRCPAYAGFGNRMITMLVVAMSRVFSEKDWMVWFDDDSLDKCSRKTLPTGRDDMGRWLLRRRTGAGR
ncbi:hypothetical protein QBC47DRAFT_216849 [Echria macrotheca]|uniref:Cytochrome P450 n=1 Tax=Echria macrotheca TaxID=438768 RepID=A0AAJ0FAP1_9PEZI|nr:hypothetical protein QBC47DRAFT_216849 [Echria macrotheca]